MAKLVCGMIVQLFHPFETQLSIDRSRHIIKNIFFSFLQLVVYFFKIVGTITVCFVGFSSKIITKDVVNTIIFRALFLCFSSGKQESMKRSASKLDILIQKSNFMCLLWSNCCINCVIKE